MKIVTSITIWNDAIGKRMSATYSEIDDSTSKVISDNARIDRVVTDAEKKEAADALIAYAQSFIDAEE